MARKKKVQKDEKKGEDILRMYRTWIDVSKEFVKNDFTPTYDKNWDLYENKGSAQNSRFSDLKNRDILWINVYYPNMELMKAAINFDNPRIFVKSEKKVLPDGTPGQDRAMIVGDYLNWINYEINTKKVFSKVRDDALIGNFGVCMVMWNTERGVGEVPDDIYIKRDQQSFLYIYPKDFLVDPECTDPYEFTDARWTGRRISMDWEYAKSTFNAPKLKHTNVAFTKDEGDTELKKDANKRDLSKCNDLKRVVVTELWVKPTPSEREQGKKGKVVYLADGYSEDNGFGPGILKEMNWPYRMEGYPFSGIRLNDRNDEFYGVPDFQQYECQVEEKSLLRTFQLQNAHITSNIKAAVNISELDDMDIEKLEDGLPSILKTTTDPRTVVSYVTPGSASAEFYTVDQKNQGDLDELSGINDLKRGNMRGSDSATEASIAQKNSAARFQLRLEKFVDLYIRIQRKFVQLGKQYLDSDTVVRVINDPQRAGSWSQSFSKRDLEGEWDVRVFVSEMSPMSAETEAAKIQQSFALLSQLTQNPLVMQLLQQEGMKFSVSKMLLEYQHLMGLDSLEIIQPATPQDQGERSAILQQAQQGGGEGSAPAISPGQFQSTANQLGKGFRGVS